MVAVEMLSMMKYDQKFEKLQVSSETLFKTCSNQQISGVKALFSCSCWPAMVVPFIPTNLYFTCTRWSPFLLVGKMLFPSPIWILSMLSNWWGILGLWLEYTILLESVYPSAHLQHNAWKYIKKYLLSRGIIVLGANSSLWLKWRAKSYCTYRDTSVTSSLPYEEVSFQLRYLGWMHRYFTSTLFVLDWL